MKVMFKVTSDNTGLETKYTLVSISSSSMRETNSISNLWIEEKKKRKKKQEKFRSTPIVQEMSQKMDSDLLVPFFLS